MKKILAILLCLLSSYLYSQILFNKLYDYNGQLETVEGIIESEDGYFMLLRTSNAPLVDRRLIVHKLDENGVSLWHKVHFVDSTAFYPTRSNDMEPTEDGGFIIAGVIWYGENDDEDAALIKFDSEGEIEWIKEYGSLSNEAAISFQQTPDKGYILGGFSYDIDPEGDFYLVKTDSAGEMEWETHLGGAGYQSGYSVDNTPDGGYVISGRGGAPPFDVDIAVAKCDSLGNQLWSKIYGGIYSNDAPHKVLALSDGNIIIAGAMGNENFSYSINRDAYIMKLNTEGEILWEKIYDEPYTTVNASNIIELQDGSILVAGIRYPNSEDDHQSTLNKYSAIGELIWRRIYTSPNPEVDTYFFGLSPASDGGFLAYGAAYDPNFDNLQEGWLIKTDSEGYTCEEVNCVVVDVAEAPVAAEGLEVFPNPTQDYLNIRWEGRQDGYARLLATTGQEVWSGWLRKDQMEKVYVRPIPAGLYVLWVEGVARKLVIR